MSNSLSEGDLAEPLTGLAAGQGLLVVPAGNTVTAYLSDATPPTITTPTAATAMATSAAGAIVSYTVSAHRPRRRRQRQLLARLRHELPSRNDHRLLHGNRHSRKHRERNIPRRRQQPYRRLRAHRLPHQQGRSRPQERQPLGLLPARRKPQ